MHDHAHDHDDGGAGGGSPISEIEARVRALETILTEKGHVDPKALDALVDYYETQVGPKNGAKVIARAWADPDFAARLREDATAAIGEMGFLGQQGEHMVSVWNDAQTHHLVVCTLCSCYPWPVLGLPPAWYKSFAYRSRAVREPRRVISEFGVEIPAAKQIRVWDSTAEIRYLVVPERPAGTDGWPEEKLAELVTRDSMIGTGLALPPTPAA
ncbi:MAG: nitrile hydratase subunit alpha [Pseudomonadota bacterium]